MQSPGRVLFRQSGGGRLGSRDPVYGNDQTSPRGIFSDLPKDTDGPDRLLHGDIPFS